MKHLSDNFFSSQLLSYGRFVDIATNQESLDVVALALMVSLM